jgi:beta-lactamase regulating signal transducer with metallopeptidase domain
MPALGLILDFAVKGLLLMALAWLAALAMRRASAAARHLVWALALGGLLALPVVSFTLPKWQLPVLPRTIVSAPPEAPATGPVRPETDVARPGAVADSDRATSDCGRTAGKALGAKNPTAGTAENASRRSPALPAASLSDEEADALSAVEGAVAGEQTQSGSALLAQRRLAGWVLAGWLAGALATLAPLVAGLFAVGRLVRRARPFRRSDWPAVTEALRGAFGLRREVRVLCAGPGAMPMAVGLFRAAILLPAEAENWPGEKRRAVLLHELAHVRRRDCLTHALGHIALALHWCNPLAWLALRRLRIERERACDDLVLLAGERPSDYAENLLDVARTLRSGALASVAAITMAQPGQLEGRLQAVLDPKRKRRVLRRAAIVAGVLLLLAITVPLAMLKFSEARVFAQMTPEQKAAFDRWYTQPVTIPPEALEVKPFAPETVEAVREFLRLWKENEDAAMACNKEWAAAVEPKKGAEAPAPSDETIAEFAEKTRPFAPLLTAFQAVVQRPGYTFSDWTAALDASKASFGDTDGVLMGRVSFVPIQGAARLCSIQARVCLKEGRIPEAIASADAAVAAGQMDPYDLLVNKMVAAAVLHIGIETHEAIAAKATDPDSRKTMLAALEAHRGQIRYDPPVAMDGVVLDQVAMTAQPRCLGVPVALEGKTGYEIMTEAQWVRLDSMKRFGALILPADPKLQKRMERQMLEAQSAHEVGTLGSRPTGLKRYLTISGLYHETIAAEMYSIALPGFEQARKHALGILKQYDDLIASVRDEDLAKSSPPATPPGPILPESVSPASVVSSASTTATADTKTKSQRPNARYEKDGILLEAFFMPDQPERLLGEDVAVTFFVENVGDRPFSLSTGGDGRGVRPERFKISALDAHGAKVADPNAHAWNGGGLMGMPKIAPGGGYIETLALSKWCLFDKPGVYTVNCRTELELTKKDGFPTDQGAYTHLAVATSFTLTLKAPTPSQAKRIVADALAAAAAKKEVSGNLPVPADAVRSPLYLPSLLKAARGGDRAAIQAIGGIQTPEAASALIELAQGWLKQKQLNLALAALDPVRPRMPDPRYYQKDKQTGTENKWSAPDRQRVEKAWRPAMVKPMLAMARELAKNTDQHSLHLASDIFEYVGTAADMPAMIEGYTHAIEATRTLPFETTQYFRPRGATYGYRFATARLLERGGKVPSKPATPGEAAVYLIALNRKSDKPFRPADWPQVALRWLGSDIPYMRELVLDYLPEPMSEEVLAMLPTFLGDSYVDLQISACRVARDHPRDSYKEPLLKIVREGEDKYTIGAAAEAAAANGMTDDEIAAVWLARATRPALGPGAPNQGPLDWLKEARKFMKGGQPMRPN